MCKIFIVCLQKNLLIMSIEEQRNLKEKYYNEAIRYMDNAKESLKKAKKEDGYYSDQKYIKVACGTAYSGMLVALDGFLLLKDIVPDQKERKSILFYQSNLSNIDKKMLDNLNSAYKILHIMGYYDGITTASVVKLGFDLAYTIIDKIKPLNTKEN